MVHHFGRVIADAGFLPEIAEGLALVQAGEATLSAARDILDTPILEARFEHFSVALPDPEAEQPALSGTDGAEPPSD
jgi:hypothetical protein